MYDTKRHLGALLLRSPWTSGRDGAAGPSSSQKQGCAIWADRPFRPEVLAFARMTIYIEEQRDRPRANPLYALRPQ